MSAEVAKIDADLEIARQQYKKRITDARTQARGDDRRGRKARCSREIAQVKAEIERQKARAPPGAAPARRRGRAARRGAAQGRRGARARRRGAHRRARQGAGGVAPRAHRAVQTPGASAREVLVVQKLLAARARSSRARRRRSPCASSRCFRGTKTGRGISPRKAISVTEQLRAATGIDIGQVAKRLGAGVPPPPPPKPNDS